MMRPLGGIESKRKKPNAILETVNESIFSSRADTPNQSSFPTSTPSSSSSFSSSPSSAASFSSLTNKKKVEKMYATPIPARELMELCRGDLAKEARIVNSWMKLYTTECFDTTPLPVHSKQSDSAAVAADVASSSGSFSQSTWAPAKKTGFQTKS